MVGVMAHSPMRFAHSHCHFARAQASRPTLPVIRKTAAARASAKQGQSCPCRASLQRQECRCSLDYQHRESRLFLSRNSVGSQAFSLLELLIVIAIMAIMGVMTMAVGPGLLKSSAMSSSLSSVASAVSLARSEAIRSRKQTYFVLAPTNTDRGYLAYAIIRKDETTNTYVTPWKKLPTGVLFYPDAAPTANRLPTTNFSYSGSNLPMSFISFVSDGALDEDSHSQKPILPLQVGTRLVATAQPDWQGQYITNEIFVELRSGKVKVQRAGETNK